MFIAMEVKTMQEQKIITSNWGQNVDVYFFSMFPMLFKTQMYASCTQLNV